FFLKVTNTAVRLSWFLKGAWGKEPMLTMSFTIGTMALLIPPISPYTKYTGMIKRAVPYNYPVLIQDDGNMPDIPSHPQDPQSPSLQWLKNLTLFPQIYVLVLKKSKKKNPQNYF
uniref:NADH dehydrogenase [ubiquinone] 1 alpha subcomplex subunit 3 n=1 Tax=Vombatus ursinus TaxID=29139 RepID=A0A4X2KHR3_VOMUR